MKDKMRQVVRISLFAVGTLTITAGLSRLAVAQNPELQQKVAELKQASAMNKQALAQYTWNQQVAISLKGEVKKTEHFQVQLGPDGKPQKTSLDPPPQPPEHEGRLKKRIVEKKKEEYEDYADQIKALIQQYVPPEKDKIEQAYQAGNVKMGPAAGAPGEYRLVFTNYVKQGDNMTIVMDKAQKNIVSLNIATYLNDPGDAVKVNVQWARVPGGPNHVASETIDGVSKQLTIATQNSNYQHM
jgi:hypothetical protein